MLVPRLLVPSLLIAALAACSGESAPEAPPVVTAPMGVADEAFTAFFKAQIDACNEWNIKVGNSAAGEKTFDGGATDPSRTAKVIERKSDTVAVIEDADGSKLLLDLAAKTVGAPEGPAVALPIRYTFCPNEIFVGPMAE